MRVYTYSMPKAKVTHAIYPQPGRGTYCNTEERFAPTGTIVNHVVQYTTAELAAFEAAFAKLSVTTVFDNVTCANCRRTFNFQYGITH